MAHSERLTSLDAFRGATIAGMMLVNNPGTWGDIYPQLRHAAWHGWTFTDWIFPFFLWIVGVAMTLSFAKRLARGDSRGNILVHSSYRAVIIFALGLFLAAFPFGLIFGHQFSLSTLRIPGVLQRIAVCYLVVSVIYLYTNLRGQIVSIVGILAFYWFLMKFVPVPGYGSGVFDPMGNLSWYVDSLLLKGHTWAYAPAPGGDPEGIVSTLPAIATTLFGVLTGHLLQGRRSPEEKTVWMFVVGNLLLLIGATLDMWMPINKNLWTVSYSVFMAGWASICLAMFYWLIDVRGYKRWATPMVIYGMNAIAVYVASGLLGRLILLVRWTGQDGNEVVLKMWIYQGLFAPLASPINASLLYAIAWDLMLFLIAWILWKRRWFLRV